jgi:hypothetical protein
MLIVTLLFLTILHHRYLPNFPWPFPTSWDLIMPEVQAQPGYPEVSNQAAIFCLPGGDDRELF